MFGPQVSVPIGKFSPFAHALLGTAHVSDTGDNTSASDASLAYAIGGGARLQAHKRYRLAFARRRTAYRFFSSTQDHLRFSTGVVFRF